MSNVRPFRGMRPKPDKVSRVASPPYDVLSSQEAREKAEGNSISFLHVVKPEINLDPSISQFDPKVYAKGAENLKRMINDGILFQDERPCFYIYKLRMGDREQIGLVAAASVNDYKENRIKKHELTHPDKEQDRANHIDHLNAQAGPVFLTYRAKKKIDDLMVKGMEKEPVYDFIGDYDVKHTFYVVDDGSLIQEIQNAFADIDTLYVADGHHRSAAASRIQDARKSINLDHTGEEEYNYFLSVIFPDSQMYIMDYNRAVKDLNGKSIENFLAEVSERFEIKAIEECCEESGYRPQRIHEFGMYLDGEWYCLTAKSGTFVEKDPIDQLDVSILQKNLLNPILGIQNPRTDKRIHFVGGVRGLGELERLVNSKEYTVAFSLYPTSITQLMSVADVDKVMPPKSTWFEPKLRSGVIIHMLD